MIDKSLPSVISAKLLFRRAAAPSSTSTSSYSSSNHRSTATCLFVHSCIRGVADVPRSILFPEESPDCCRIDFCRTKKSQADVMRENVSYREWKRLFEYNNCELSTQGNGEIFVRRIYVIPGLNSLLNHSQYCWVDRAKGKLGWKLRLAARIERLVMNK